MPGVTACLDMTWPGLAKVVLPRVVSWQTACVILAWLLLVTGSRWVAERQRRRTLVDLVKQAPEGTTVFMERGPGGPAMLVQVGHGPRHLPRRGG
jgi:hypothetical protein